MWVTLISSKFNDISSIGAFTACTMNGPADGIGTSAGPVSGEQIIGTRNVENLLKVFVRQGKNPSLIQLLATRDISKYL